MLLFRIILLGILVLSCHSFFPCVRALRPISSKRAGREQLSVSLEELVDVHLEHHLHQQRQTILSDIRLEKTMWKRKFDDVVKETASNVWELLKYAAGALGTILIAALQRT